MATSSTTNEQERSSGCCIPCIPQSLQNCLPLPIFSNIFQLERSITNIINTNNNDRGCIAFFSTYRPPLPLHIFSSPVPPTSDQDETPMIGGATTDSYNYNGHVIPPAALGAILHRANELGQSTMPPQEVGSGWVSGLVFVSERTDGLETLHIAVRLYDDGGVVVGEEVFNFAQVYGTFDGVRMEDGGCVAGEFMVYVSTMERNEQRRQPWTAVYRTHLRTGVTERLTPPVIADLSPSVSPSGKKIAVASFQEKEGGWMGEIENLQTDIIVIDVEEPLANRTLVVKNGGWPTWGSEDVLFFHRKVDNNWGVFHADISNGFTLDTRRVTPDDIDAVTPAAIDATTVAVATIRMKSEFGDVRVEDQYRHIEIFDLNEGPENSTKITQVINPLIDHLNPFVIVDKSGQLRIGYNRCHDFKHEDDFKSQLHGIQSPDSSIEVCRASGVFPSFSKDGKKLAFVNNEFTVVYVADANGKREVYQSDVTNGVFSPMWDQNPEKDTLYVCVGSSFNADAAVEIWAIHGVSGDPPYNKVQLTTGGFNNAFPSTNPDGTKLVFRSTRDWMQLDSKHKHKNLYIMEDTQTGESAGGQITRLTNGPWTDTHCEWSPNGKWIVFSSTCDKPESAPETDNNLDPGYFAVFLIKVDDPNTCVRVAGSGYDLAGHVNHPFFSPDGRSICVVSDLAAVSADPMSIPLFLHSVRPYGDIFIFDIDSEDIHKNKDLKHFKRVTHSRFENSTAMWSNVTFEELQELWKVLVFEHHGVLAMLCPFLHPNGGHGFHLTGHLCVPDRLC